MYRHPYLNGAAAPPALADVPVSLRKLSAGKVRSLYDVGDLLLIVASDRISTFDVVMREPIPGKGIVLSTMSAFWFELFADLVPNHFVSDDPDEWPGDVIPGADRLAGRAMLVQRCKRIDVECVVRGYLAGNGWNEYRQHGTLAGEPLPPSLTEASRLPEPRFTPTTKEAEGHDRPLTRAEVANTIGSEEAALLERQSIALYEAAHAHALARGIIVADTKFEFGWWDGDLLQIDESLTPDSSRFWPLAGYEPGRTPPSLDKQPVRDLLEATGWDKRPPPPPLTPEAVSETSERYRSAFQRLTGPPLDGQ